MVARRIKPDEEGIEDAWLRAEAAALGETASARAESLADALLEEGTASASEAMTWREAERFFVEGEDRLGPATGVKVVWWPSAYHVAVRFRLLREEVERRSVTDRWWEKRWNYQRQGTKAALAAEANPRPRSPQREAEAPRREREREDLEAEEGGEPASAAGVAAVSGPVDPLAITEAVIRAYARAVAEGAGLKSEAIAGFDKAVRLRQFLLNDGAGSGKEATQPVTLDELARRHAATRELEAETEADPVLSGVTALGDGGGGAEGEERADEVPGVSAGGAEQGRTRKPKSKPEVFEPAEG